MLARNNATLRNKNVKSNAISRSKIAKNSKIAKRKQNAKRHAKRNKLTYRTIPNNRADLITLKSALFLPYPLDLKVYIEVEWP